MEPQAFWILHFDALPPSLRDSMVSNTHYKVHMTCVLYTARISNVDFIMFYKQNKKDGRFFSFSCMHKCSHHQIPIQLRELKKHKPSLKMITNCIFAQNLRKIEAVCIGSFMNFLCSCCFKI